MTRKIFLYEYGLKYETENEIKTEMKEKSCIILNKRNQLGNTNTKIPPKKKTLNEKKFKQTDIQKQNREMELNNETQTMQTQMVR